MGLELGKMRFSVLGMARSGLAAARYLGMAGADVLASDMRPAEDWADGLPESVKCHGGGNLVREGDIVVISPGIPPSSDVYRMAEKKARSVISDIELFARVCPPENTLVAVTGTDGKTTTTTMIQEIVRAAGLDVETAGNIGRPVMELPALLEASPGTVVLLEVSSAQLMNTDSLSPKVSVFTNIAADHIAYHGSFEGYLDAKKKLLAGQKAGSITVMNESDTELMSWELPVGVVRKTFGGRDASVGLFKPDELRVLGGHNVQNAAAAALACEAIGIEPDVIAKALHSFQGVEHRMEFVKTIRGVSFYNDSKATNPHAASAVLASVDARIILIAGGSEKGSDFGNFAELVARKVKTVVLTGPAGVRLEEAILRAGAKTRIIRLDGLEKAVQKAFELASKDDMVLLAPASASFDEFNDYEHRGREFKRFVDELEEIDHA